MSKFRKKPVVIEAEQWIASNPEEPPMPPVPDNLLRKRNGWWEIRTLEGWLQPAVGDWIIRGVAGEYYPCKPEIFEATYDPVE